MGLLVFCLFVFTTQYVVLRCELYRWHHCITVSKGWIPLAPETRFSQVQGAVNSMSGCSQVWRVEQDVCQCLEHLTPQPQLVALFGRCRIYGLAGGNVTRDGLWEFKESLLWVCLLCFVLAIQDVSPPLLSFLLLLPCLMLPRHDGLHRSGTVSLCKLILFEVVLVYVFCQSHRKMANLTRFVSSEVCFLDSQINSIFSLLTFECANFLPLDSLPAILN